MKKFLKQHGVILMAGIFLIGCAGQKADIERARHLIATGDSDDAEDAADILEDIVEKASGNIRLEAAILYGGALLSAAGFNPKLLFVNILHRNEDESVAQTLRNVIDDEDDGLERVRLAVTALTDIAGTLDEEEGDFAPNLEPTVRENLEDEYDFVAVPKSTDYQNAPARLKRDLDTVLANSHTYLALYMILKVSGFDSSDEFDVDECRDLLTSPEVGEEGVDIISLSLFRGRAYYGRSGLDDARLGDSDTNKQIRLLNDAQRGGGSSFAIDADRDGFIGEAADGPQDADAKADIVCQYLEDSLGD